MKPLVIPRSRKEFSPKEYANFQAKYWDDIAKTKGMKVKSGSIKPYDPSKQGKCIKKENGI